jgi:hypothetical protein
MASDSDSLKVSLVRLSKVQSQSLKWKLTRRDWATYHLEQMIAPTLFPGKQAVSVNGSGQATMERLSRLNG